MRRYLWRGIAAAAVAVAVSLYSVSEPQSPSLSFSVVIALPGATETDSRGVASESLAAAADRHPESIPSDPVPSRIDAPASRPQFGVPDDVDPGRAFLIIGAVLAALWVLGVLFRPRRKWRRLEEDVARRFERDGWDARVTPPSKDGGYDVDLWRDGLRAIAECKLRAKGSVGVGVVRQVYGVMKAERAQHAYILTNTSFTRGAREFAAGARTVTLVDGPRLKAWLNSRSRLEDLAS